MPRPCNAGDPGPTSADRLFERRTCPIDAADLLFRKAATAWGWGKSDHCVSWKDGWHGTNARWSGLIVKGAPELGVGPMVRDDARSGIRYHLKVHSFRTLTVILAWIFLALAFYQDPAVLTGAQRLIQRGIEFVGDNIPPPWGPRIEFVFRGGRRTNLAPNHAFGVGASRRPFYNSNDIPGRSAPKCRVVFRLRRLRRGYGESEVV
jgi:hypothetical protein